MRIDDDADAFLEPRAENYVGGLAGDARQGEQLVHVVRNFATEVAEYFFRCSHDRFRLITKESGGADVRLELLWFQPGEILDGRILLKQARRDAVHVHVSG